MAWASDLPDAECWAQLVTEKVLLYDGDATRFLCSSAAVSNSSMSVLYLGGDPRTRNQVALGDRGELVAQSVSRTTPWQPLVEAMTHALLMAPEAADVGMIKNAANRASSWGDLHISIHQPARMVMDYENSRHLGDEHVIDAHGISLLTDKHLAHAHDLTDWTIEQVAEGRYLVKATDLEPWFGQPAPDEATLAKARADFDDVILNWDTILTKPGPYTSGNTSITGR